MTCSIERTPSEPSGFPRPQLEPGTGTFKRTIAEVYPGTIVTPGLSMAAAD